MNRTNARSAKFLRSDVHWKVALRALVRFTRGPRELLDPPRRTSVFGLADLLRDGIVCGNGLPMNPMAFPFSAVFAAGVLLGCAGTGWAHGSLHEQLAAVNAQLEKQPANADLLLWRADLHRQHGQWEEAVRDIAAAQLAGAEAGALAMARAQLAVSRADWEMAARELPVLARELPENAEAWRIAGTVETARARHAAAAAAWRAAVDRADPPRPDDFISLARASRAAGADDGALAALDAGIARLGEASALVVRQEVNAQ